MIAKITFKIVTKDGEECLEVFTSTCTENSSLIEKAMKEIMEENFYELVGKALERANVKDFRDEGK